VKWSETTVGRLIELEYGEPLKSENRDSDGKIPVAGSNGIVGYHSRSLVKGPGIVIGRKGSAGKVTWLEKDFWPIDTAFYVRPKVDLNLKWLFYFLRQLNLERLAIVTGVPGLNRNSVYPTPASLPAPSEQNRIVETLEQADSLRQKRSEADVLSYRILPALFNYYFGEPTANPNNWPTHQLLELADFVSGATPSKENSAFWEGKIPWVSPKDMKQVELHDAIDHVSDLAMAETNLKLLPRDTVLIVVRGMILAHTVPVCLARVPLTINQDMKGLRPKGGVSAEFLQWALLAQHSELLRLVSTAAHGTRKLDIDALESLRIPVPPLPRRDLIKKWTDIVREQQAASTKRTQCRESIEQIWRTMLNRAFTGELTAQWREAHMKELNAEMEQQARLLRSNPNGRN
jgi:type I restriction enzyme S subunit